MKNLLYARYKTGDPCTKEHDHNPNSPKESAYLATTTQDAQECD